MSINPKLVYACPALIAPGRPAVHTVTFTVQPIGLTNPDSHAHKGHVLTILFYSWHVPAISIFKYNSRRPNLIGVWHPACGLVKSQWEANGCAADELSRKKRQTQNCKWLKIAAVLLSYANKANSIGRPKRNVELKRAFPVTQGKQVTGFFILNGDIGLILVLENFTD